MATVDQTIPIATKPTAKKRGRGPGRSTIAPVASAEEVLERFTKRLRKADKDNELDEVLKTGNAILKHHATLQNEKVKGNTTASLQALADVMRRARESNSEIRAQAGLQEPVGEREPQEAVEATHRPSDCQRLAATGTRGTAGGGGQAAVSESDGTPSIKHPPPLSPSISEYEDAP